MDSKAPTLEVHLIGNEFLEVFRDDLLDIPMKRERHFSIDHNLDMQPIFIHP